MNVYTGWYHVNFDIYPAPAAHVITWAGHDQGEPDLTWAGMGKYKKYLSDLAQTFTDIAGKNIYYPNKV